MIQFILYSIGQLKEEWRGNVNAYYEIRVSASRIQGATGRGNPRVEMLGIVSQKINNNIFSNKTILLLHRL